MPRVLPNALSFYRAARALESRRLHWLADRVASFGGTLHRAHVSQHARIGQDVELGYGGIGIVIAAGVHIGDGSRICQDVTVDGCPGVEGVPQLGKSVLVGAGAKVLGPITIGDGAEIGASAVVTEDVPAGGVVVGVPGHRLIR